MYSLFPAIVSALFLGFGLYVVAERGFNRTTISFFALCLTTFFWQATWAVLFQVRAPVVADYLVKFGYLLILFLPTSLYHFLVEISERPKELRYVYLSYTLAAMLGLVLLGSNLFVNGHYNYFFGYYPKAGLLHPLHVLQTVIVVNRGLYVTWREQGVAPPDKKSRLRLCIISLFIYFFAAIDYLCNYGLEFYPPGVVFTVVSLGILVMAVAKYELMSPVTVASSVAHEIRTPLGTIRMQAESMSRILPELFAGYRLAVQNGLCDDKITEASIKRLDNLSGKIMLQVDRSNVVIDMLLAAAKMDNIDQSTFARHSINDCVCEAVETYPFTSSDRAKVDVFGMEDFEFYGSHDLLLFVLFNLLKNSLHEIHAANKGEISIVIVRGETFNRLIFTDTASGIPANVIPRIFDAFYTANKTGGTGIGLSFCKSVITAFGGSIRCESELGRYTTFTLAFPVVKGDGEPAQLSATTVSQY